ncbi:ribbon-helix-helix domain-containing protein [Planktothrix agardhii]|jgi:DNA repair exonuclease SbcCD ATPase subunit|uniref:Ribbon-helix-helix protein CopG domain-containing protein n=1 Tax=Planktothrix agardhii TaxID=1160 RepID=A0A1J1JAL0_PLAAG|nr:ribbon-helix-helix protein, CopG family [Planktothrix agardhii]MCF3606910.1 ribbon-helix-helix protein, CopG family [Planktothrix agardhii 1033]MBG0748037.1 ribbon-helix-helix protein, CopG family [Planktothrix agardhii KL2]MCB8752906.1 ribbon-helix-helix protein, CopG family [Planktothrix agardhii 1810]MCB8786644.1 ribbon-helix-helix protein, CopG family [Planktothrix agardhii 1025]MCF3575625.1 ribbon-helix-helix protein, CopG family [Planktothrix agardhii 1812]
MSTNRKKRTTPATRNTSAISDKVKVTVSLTADAAQQVEVLAKELGVSKSELFERLTKEHLNQATPEEETTATVNVESPAPATDDTALKQEIEAQANTIQELKQQLAQTVSVQTYQTLKQEAEQQKQTLADLQQQLQHQGTETMTAETHQALQNQLEQEQNTILQLNQRLETLEKEVEKSNSSLAELQVKQGRIAELEAKLDHSISEDNYHNLEYLCATQKTQMATLEQKLASLISTKTQHQGTASYDALKNYLQEQDDLINVLEKRVLELHGLASFGESQLSKWRNRTFNG